MACRGRRPHVREPHRLFQYSVRPPLEDVEQFLVDVPAAVVPDVDDDALAVPELVDLVLEAPERPGAHGTDVHVGDLAVGGLLDELAVLPDPLLVLDVAEGRHGPDPHVTRRLGIGRGPDLHRHELVQRVVERPPDVVGRPHGLPVDGQHRVADLEAEPLLVGGAVAVDVRDPVGAAGRLDLEPEVPGRVLRGHLPARRPAHAHVRRVEFADHLVGDVVQVLVLAHVREQRLVARLHGRPVDAVHAARRRSGTSSRASTRRTSAPTRRGDRPSRTARTRRASSSSRRRVPSGTPRRPARRRPSCDRAWASGSRTRRPTPVSGPCRRW